MGGRAKYQGPEGSLYSWAFAHPSPLAVRCRYFRREEFLGFLVFAAGFALGGVFDFKVGAALFFGGGFWSLLNG